jgi:hypothetical protein
MTLEERYHKFMCEFYGEEIVDTEAVMKAKEEAHKLEVMQQLKCLNEALELSKRPSRFVPTANLITTAISDANAVVKRNE